MILLLGGLWAHAQPAPAEPVSPPAEYERLLGEPLAAEEPTADEATPSSGALSLGIPLVVGGIGLVLLWLGRKSLLGRRASGTGSELRIVGRAALGPSAGLVVLEVRGRSGTWRRLVVGTGDGPPRLVADLGEPEFGILGPVTEDDDDAPEGPLAVLDHHARHLIDEVLGERRTTPRRSTLSRLG